ncbi:hypothetical protein [Sporocytophaga myxococcoides]|nr:hypothetical protein [Sporocytophaga myxococcoides]
MYKTLAKKRITDIAPQLVDINSINFVGSFVNQSYVYENDFVNEKEKGK